MAKEMTYGSLPILDTGTGSPVADVGNIYLVWNG